ncbi:dephospho-CoA kinase [Actinomycetaceae bacterium L2_0104]
MLVVCLTGGIGAGKSTAARMLAEFGAHTMSLDDIARGVLDPGTDGTREVAELWPEAVRDGVVDRQFLAGIVFSDDAALRRLNSITHPRTWSAAELLLAEWEQTDPSGIAVIELALLAQSPRKYQAHLNMVIAADLSVRIERLVRLRGMSEDDARSRIASQARQERLGELADIWVDNSDGEGQLRGELAAVWADRLEPFAENLTAGRRVKGLPVPPDSGAVARIMARLEHHGLDPRQGGPMNAEPGSAADVGTGTRIRNDEAALRRAGFLPVLGESRFVSADPAYEFEVDSD